MQPFHMTISHLLTILMWMLFPTPTKRNLKLAAKQPLYVNKQLTFHVNRYDNAFISDKIQNIATAGPKLLVVSYLTVWLSTHLLRGEILPRTDVEELFPKALAKSPRHDVGLGSLVASSSSVEM